MNKDVINQINQDFYQAIADSFDATRQTPSPGWDQLLPYLKDKELRVLDLACGNGRFYQFLKDQQLAIKQYLGLDTDTSLLQHAQARSDDKKISFIEADITHDLPPIPCTPNLVTLFGILHHFPDLDIAIKLWSTIATRMPTNSLVIFTTWEYHNDPRFEKKRVLPHTVKQSYPDLDIDQLHPYDTFLTWKNNPKWIRYMRRYTLEDIEHLAAESRLRIIDRYESDGKSNNLNKYYVAQVMGA